MASFITRKQLKHPEPEVKPEKEKHPLRLWAGRFFMGLGITFFVIVCLGFLSFLNFVNSTPKLQPLPKDFVLTMELRGTLPDVTNQNQLLAQFMPPETSLLDFLRAIDHAKTDDRVRTLAVRIYDGNYSLTQIETIRDAVKDFRQSGKKAFIYTDSFGGYSNGLGEYWLATAFDEIWVQPIGLVSLTGLRLEQPYFEEALSNIGVEMQMEQRKAFKTGPEMYQRNSMSAEAELSLKDIVQNIMETIVSQNVASRDIDVNTMTRAINESPLMLDQALQTGLIDQVGYLDEFEKRVKLTPDSAVEGEEATEGDTNQSALNDGDEGAVKFVSIERYKFEPHNKKVQSAQKAMPTKVAVVNISGAILDTPDKAATKSPKAFLVPGDLADAQKISGAIRMAADDKNIKVIILRINSPGGSPGASETIRRAVVQAKEKGKYVIASMGDTAASGGYWVAVNADMIIASKLTLTGSIGVYGGKPNLSGLWDKIGVTWQAVEYGDNASMWSPNKPYSDSERARLNAMMDHVYEAFTTRVQQGRDIPAEQVERIAKGRVWIGLDAQPLDLVDQLGGFDAAMVHAAKKIEVEDWHDMSIVVLPRNDDPLAEIAEMLGLPVQASMPKLPQMLVPSFYPEASVTLPPMQMRF